MEDELGGGKQCAITTGHMCLELITYVKIIDVRCKLLCISMFEIKHWTPTAYNYLIYGGHREEKECVCHEIGFILSQNSFLHRCQ